MKFLFDEMLKRLSHWCRILGIYSEFIEGKSDDELLEYAKENKLVFVTRDVPLSKKCQKKSLRVIFIESGKLEEQLVQLLRETKAEITFPKKMRCAVCNGELAEADKEKVKDKIPDDVYKEDKELWQCRSCGKAYWKGGHWDNITRIYETVMKGLQGKAI